MSFDCLAPHYRWMEIILAGEKLQRCRTQFLSEVQGARNVLILGEGNGRFLSEFLRANKVARITCVDSSAAMLQQIQKRLAQVSDLQRVRFLQADALQMRFEGDYDLIVTHFFLDCFTPGQLGQLISVIAGASSKDAKWLVSDFSEAPRGIARLRSRLVLFSMYCFFRFVAKLPAKRLTACDEFLKQNGFILRDREVSEWGLLHADLWYKKAGVVP